MNKGTKILVFITVTLIGFSFVFGFMTRNSLDLNNKILDFDEFRHFYFENPSSPTSEFDTTYFNEDIQTIEDLESKADLIVIVTNVKERELVKQATKTTLEIDEVLKGDLKSGDEIILYEPAYFIKWIDDHKNGYFNSSGYQLIQDGSKYILFLSHLKAPNGYHWSAEEKRSFLPVSQLYSKYPLNDDMNLEAGLMDIDQLWETWGQVQYFEVLTDDDEILNHYISLKNQVLTKYSES